MARVLFISADIGGNVPPTLAIARELARRGHDVAIGGLSRRVVAGDGIESITIRALDGMDVSRAAGPLGHLPTLTRMALGRTVSRDVRAILRARPWDAVVVDGVMLVALREAVLSGVPTAALFHSLGAFWSTGLANPIVNAALRPAGLAPVALLRAVDARLLPTDPDLDPAFRGRSAIAFDWLGTTEQGAPQTPRSPGRKQVLVSLSSAWQRGQGDLYQRILLALATLPVDVTVTTGDVQLEGELVAPPNAVIHGRVPHEQLMPGMDLVIGHGGHSTTLKALAHGIPLVVIPLDPTSDQPLMGRTIAAAGLGAVVSRRAKTTAIREAVSRVLGDADIVTKAAQTGKRLRTHRGAEVGASRIEAILRPT